MKNGTSLTVLMLVGLVCTSALAQAKKDQVKSYIGPSAAEMAGFVTYDAEGFLQKASLKDDAKAAGIRAVIWEYNAAVDSMAYVNRLQLGSLASQEEETKTLAVQTADFKPLKAFYEYLEVSTAALKKNVEKEEVELNARLELVLTDSQYHRWLSYQKKRKKKSHPRLPMPMSGPIV